MASQPHGSNIADSFAQRVDLTMNIAAARSLSDVLYRVYDGRGGDASLTYALMITLALSILGITGSQYLVHNRRPEQDDMVAYIVGRIRRVLAVQMSDLFIRSLQSAQALPLPLTPYTGWQAALYWYFVKIAGSTVFVFAMIYICRKVSGATDHSSSTLEMELGRVTIAMQYMLAGSIGSVIVDNGQQLPELYAIVGVGCMAAIPSTGKSADHYFALLTNVLCMVWANVVIQLTVNNSSIQGPVQQAQPHSATMTTDVGLIRVSMAGGIMRIVAITSITILIHAGVSMGSLNTTYVTSLRGYTQWMLATTVIPALATSLFVRDYEQVLLLGVGVIMLKVFSSKDRHISHGGNPRIILHGGNPRIILHGGNPRIILHGGKPQIKDDSAVGDSANLWSTVSVEIITLAFVNGSAVYLLGTVSSAMGSTNATNHNAAWGVLFSNLAVVALLYSCVKATNLASL